MATTTSHRNVIPAAIAWLGLVCAAALIASGAWFLQGTTASAGAGTRGGASVTASGGQDPPWTSQVLDPPWT